MERRLSDSMARISDFLSDRTKVWVGFLVTSEFSGCQLFALRCSIPSSLGSRMKNTMRFRASGNPTPTVFFEGSVTA